MLISPRALSILGPIPDDLFMYWEDVEYCFRATQSGLKIGIVWDAIAYHSEGASSRDDVDSRATERSSLYYRYTARNRLIVAYRNRSIDRHYAFLYTPLVLTKEAMKIIIRESDRRRKLRSLARGTWEGASQHLVGYWWWWRRSTSEDDRGEIENILSSAVRRLEPILVNPLRRALGNYSESLRQIIQSDDVNPHLVSGMKIERVDGGTAVSRLAGALKLVMRVRTTTRNTSGIPS